MSKKKESILVVLVAGIGDMILGSPALQSIRNGHPDADIHLLTNTQALPLAKNYSYIDRVWPFPLRELLRNKRGFFQGIKTIQQLRRQKFDICVNLFKINSVAGAARMGLIFLAIGAEERIGHNAKGFGNFLTKKVPADVFGSRHVAESMLEVATLAGGVPDGVGIEVFWDDESETKWSQLFQKGEGDENEIVIGINPGGDRANRRYPPEKYSIVANKLVEKYKAKIVILGGPGEEELASRIQSFIKHGKAIDLSGKMSLSELAYISSRLNLLVTNDSGPMHIAAAAGAPLVCIFGPEDPGLTRPYITSDKYTIIRTSLDCQPCFKDDCEHVSCLKEIEEEEVFEASCEMLNRR